MHFFFSFLTKLNLQSPDKSLKNIHSLGLNVNLVEDDMGTRLGQNFFERNRGKSVGTGSHTNAREVTFALEMKPDATYIVVPSTFKPNQNGQFLLRFVSNQPIRCEVPL